MQWVMYKTGLETKDELKVITVFHLIGLLLEIYKVHFGSWSYPEEAYSKVLEFHFTAALCMQVLQVTYAKRGEDYIYKCIIGRKLFCNTSRSNDLLQFFTHHFLYDFRWFLTLLLFIVFFRTFVEFSLRGVTYKMPLVLSFSYRILYLDCRKHRNIFRCMAISKPTGSLESRSLK